jgi:hypothetical protein
LGFGAYEVTGTNSADHQDDNGAARPNNAVHWKAWYSVLNASLSRRIQRLFSLP